MRNSLCGRVSLIPVERLFAAAQGAALHALLEPRLARASKAYAESAKEATFVDQKLLPGRPYAAVALPG